MKISFLTKAEMTVGDIPDRTFFYFKGNTEYVYLKLKHTAAGPPVIGSTRVLCLKTLKEILQNSKTGPVEVLGTGSVLSLEIE